MSLVQSEDQGNEEAEGEAEGGPGDLFHSHEMPERGQREVEMMLNVTITKTSTGMADYIQIMSDDQISVNIVLVADKIKVDDHRTLQQIKESQEE